MKEIVFEELRKRCEEYIIEEHMRFTAVNITDAPRISHNTALQYLDERAKTGSVIKANSRPVYFFVRKAVEDKWSGVVTRCTFNSFGRLTQELVGDAQGSEQLIGCNSSLSSVVEHYRAAVPYPGGLLVLINGPTGTGKSMIASMMYECTVNQDVIGKNKKFVAVNCSEYVNNLELLIANLFGNVKGVCTGADEDDPGLISLADGGLLFLDEVCCLRAECQEKLFFFMDKGIYREAGDNENWYYFKCQLVFTTTGGPQNVLLKILLRRIPITITVPTLKNRPLTEKRELIYAIFTKGSEHLGKEILINDLAYQSLMGSEFIGNVGVLKNAIEAAYASSLPVYQGGPKLKIQVADSPDYISLSLTSVQLKSSTHGMQEAMIPVERLKSPLDQASPLLHLHSQLVTQYERYQTPTSAFPTCMEKTGIFIQSYTGYVMSHGRYQKNTGEACLLKLLGKIYSTAMNKYSINIPNNKIKTYSHIPVEYSKCVVDVSVWVSMCRKMVKVLMERVQERVPRIFHIVKEIVESIHLNLDLELDELLLVIIAIAFTGYQGEEINSYVGAILRHGYSIASNVADTVNCMLGQYAFGGIGMEINITIDKVTQLTDNYLKRKGTIHELIFLVDMGSLEEVYAKTKPISDCSTVLINNVSTAMASGVGSYIMQGRRMEKILQSVREDHQLSIHYLKSKKKKFAILSIRATGSGTARKTNELLEGLPPRRIDLEVIPYNCQQLVENGNRNSVFNQYQTELTVGTLNPKVSGVPFMATESVMMNDEIGVLEQLMQRYLGVVDLEAFNQSIIKNFTLSSIVNRLTILNGGKITDDVEEIVGNLEEDLNEELDATREVGLYVHISCLVECPILRQGIEYVEGMEKAIEGKKDRVGKVKGALNGVETGYSVELLAPEALYALNCFRNPE